MSAAPAACIKLGEVLSLSDRAISSSQLPEVNLAGVYSFGRGLFKRGPMRPAETSYKTYNRLVCDDFVISQPKAWEGALARVTDQFEGWFLSPVFPTFTADPRRLLPAYLEWYCKRKTVWQDLQILSKGMGARRETVSPEQFLTLEIPLPPLDEQRRIVARIEELAAKVEEIQVAKADIQIKSQAMLRAVFSGIIEGAPRQAMSEVAPLIRRPVELKMGEQYPELGIRSFGKGTFHKPSLDYLSVGTKRLFSIRPGDLLFSNVFAWEGAIAVAKLHDEARFGSHRFMTCVATQGVTTSNFLCFYFLTDDGLRKIGEASPGGAGRNRTLGLEKLARIEVPIPTYSKQLWFNRLRHKVADMLTLQVETAAELDAMLPAILDKAFKGEL